MNNHRSIKHFINNIFAFDWKANFKASEDEIAGANFGLVMTGSMITILALLVGMVYQLSIGYTKLVLPYLVGIPFFLIFCRHLFLYQFPGKTLGSFTVNHFPFLPGIAFPQFHIPAKGIKQLLQIL